MVLDLSTQPIYQLWMKGLFIPINIYLDLSKTFDTLDYTIVLQKLHYYDIREIE